MMWVLCIAWSVTTFHLYNLSSHYAGDFSLIWVFRVYGGSTLYLKLGDSFHRYYRYHVFNAVNKRVLVLLDSLHTSIM